MQVTVGSGNVSSAKALCNYWFEVTLVKEMVVETKYNCPNLWQFLSSCYRSTICILVLKLFGGVVCLVLTICPFTFVLTRSHVWRRWGRKFDTRGALSIAPLVAVVMRFLFGMLLTHTMCMVG